MDDRLRLLQYLYGEDVDDPSFPRRMTADDELRREYERLQATKEELDQRSSPRPDPAVVDRVVDAAAEASTRAREGDRAPRSPSRSWNRRLQGASALVAVLLIVGLGWWQLDLSAPGGAGPEALEQGASAASVEDVDESAVPEWDDSDELIRLHRRIEHVRARSASGWGGTIQTIDQGQP